MLQVTHTADAADLLVQGTYVLRDELDRLARTASTRRLVAERPRRPRRDDAVGIVFITQSRSTLGRSPNSRIA